MKKNVCAVEKSAKLNRRKMKSELGSTSPHFAWYGKSTITNEPKNLDATCTQLHYHLKC